MTAAPKFYAEDLLRNRQTKEDGHVRSVYRGTDTDEWMYRVYVPVSADTWLRGHYVSDWEEKHLTLSANAVLRSSGHLPGSGPPVD
jgi:hypothetical protein